MADCLSKTALEALYIWKQYLQEITVFKVRTFFISIFTQVNIRNPTL